jgi:F0F1-type ATP synthase assembly protein I
MEPKKPGRPESGTTWRYDVFGYTFAGTILLFAGLGYLLDRWLGTRPLLVIIGTLTGAALAFAWVYTKVRQDEQASRDRRHEHDPGSG